MVEHKLPKLLAWVRFPSPAPVCCATGKMLQTDVCKNEKSASRMVAVQLMYAFVLNCEKPDVLLNNFFKFDANTQVNKGFLKRLVMKFTNDIDLNKILTDNTINISNIPLIIMCVLKVASIELMYEKTDIAVIIDEYLNVARCFVDKKELAFINAVLDKVAGVVRCKK